jgi:GTP-binding protein YchF
MKVALIGLPQCGKTTLFATLTGTDASRQKGSFQIGTVKVPDGRVDKLSEMYKPKKTTYATIEVVEAHQAEKVGKHGSSLDSAFLNLVKPMDAFLLVVRAFDEEGLCDPKADVESVVAEMLLADLMVIENRLDRAAADLKKGKPSATADEVEALEKCKALLDQDLPLRADAALAALPVLRNYAFLTARPLLVVVNAGEGDAGADSAAVMARYGLPVQGLPSFVCCAQIEEEIQGMPEADRPAFREAMGIQEPVLDVVVRQVYAALGLISFLTSGEDEVRAWTIKNGTLAPRAAGAVHSDIEKGFIRAEIIGYDDFVTLGSEAAARRAGRYRLEGKEYAVQDGDIVHFRFNV